MPCFTLGGSAGDEIGDLFIIMKKITTTDTPIFSLVELNEEEKKLLMNG